MRQSTSNLLPQPSIFDVEDSKFILRALERQAFENVVYALRAQGPLTRYKELILNHLKAALFISDDEFNVRLRIAANNPYLSTIAKELNPSCDNFSDWMVPNYDLTGLELAKIQKKATKQSNPKMISKVNEVLHEMRKHNSSLPPNESDGVFRLMQLPQQPYVPERLRNFSSKEVVEITRTREPEPIPVKTHKEEILLKKPTKNSVGRPRKKPREEDQQQQRRPSSSESCKTKRQKLVEKEPIAVQQDQLNDQKVEDNEQQETTPNNSNVEGEKMAISQEYIPPAPVIVSKRTDLTNHPMPSPTPNAKSEGPTESDIQGIQGQSSKYGYTEAQVVSTSSDMFDYVKRRKNRLISKEKQANKEATYVCARLRPFVFASEQTNRTRYPDKGFFGSKRNGGNQKDGVLSVSANESQLNRNTYYPQFHPKSKYYTQTTMLLAKNTQNSDQYDRILQHKRLRICDDSLADNYNKKSVESSQKESNTESATLHVATAPYVVVGTNQQQNNCVRTQLLDHSYPSPHPDQPISDSNCYSNLVNIDSTITVSNQHDEQQRRQQQQLVQCAENGDDGICRRATTTTTTPLLSNSSIPTSSAPVADILEALTLKNPVAEASGLDFLASTASLLGPIETTTASNPIR